MNYYALLPLAGLIANITLFIIVLNSDSKSKLNRQYILFTFALILWSIAELALYTANNTRTYIIFNDITVITSTLSAATLLHFFLIFTQSKFLKKTRNIILLYLPAAFFIFLKYFTNTFKTIDVYPSYWGYSSSAGIVRYFLASYVALYALISIIILYEYSSITTSQKAKIQSRYLIAGVSVVIIGGVFSSIIFPLFIEPIVHIDIMPLTTTFCTVNAFFVVFAIVKYKLMNITASVAADSIVRTMADYLVVVDRDRVVVLLSDSTFLSLGYSRDDLLGRSVDLLFDDVSVVSRLFSDLDSGVGVRNVEFFVLSCDRRLVPVSVNGSVLRDSVGVIGYVFVMRDVTLTRALISDLEFRDKVLFDTNFKLQVANSRLKDLDKEKDEFISLAAHELKTPLTSIRGFSQVLLSRDVWGDSDSKHFVELINKNTDRLYSLVTDLVDSSRINLGKLNLDVRDVDVYPLFNEIKENMDLIIRNAGINSEFVIGDGLPHLLADPSRVLQVLRNILINAVHYTSKGGLISLRVYSGVNDSGFVQFEVRDTGEGIPLDKQDKIFSRFYQAEDSGSIRKSSGSGLGLSICKGLVEMMKGKIWFESQQGKGTTFYFTIPTTTQTTEQTKNTEQEKKTEK